jgi:hypothetical protein
VHSAIPGFLRILERVHSAIPGLLGILERVRGLLRSPVLDQLIDKLIHSLLAGLQADERVFLIPQYAAGLPDPASLAEACS